MKRAGVIGWPVDHSLSPVLHGYWLKKYGIDGAYEKIPAAPEEFAATIRRLRDEGYAGVNVTVPHKEAAFKLADSNDEVAQIARASNLLAFRDNAITGSNTDAYGLMEALKKEIGTLGGKSAVLLGSGGAARGAIIALRQMGASVINLLARNPERAAPMVKGVVLRWKRGGDSLSIGVMPMDRFEQVADIAALVVNATSAGMGSNPPLALDLSALPMGAVVCDMVYSPLETQLLKDAKARGLKTIDGLGMLMHQAVPSFEAFFGVRPDVTPGLRAALVEALGNR